MQLLSLHPASYAACGCRHRTALTPCLPDGPQARPEVEALVAYSAPLEGRRGLLRLDFNENTVGPSPKVVDAIRAIPADHYAIYPEYDGLREAVVASLGGMGLSPAHIGLFNGVDAALHAAVPRLRRPGRPAAHHQPHLRLLHPLRPHAGHDDRGDPLSGGRVRLSRSRRSARRCSVPVVPANPAATGSRRASCCSATPTTPPAPAWRRSGSSSWRPPRRAPWWWWMSSMRPSPATACCHHC